MSFLTKVGYCFKKNYWVVYKKDLNFKLIIIFKCYLAKKVIPWSIALKYNRKWGPVRSIWSDFFTPKMTILGSLTYLPQKNYILAITFYLIWIF